MGVVCFFSLFSAGSDRGSGDDGSRHVSCLGAGVWVEVLEQPNTSHALSESALASYEVPRQCILSTNS